MTDVETDWTVHPGAVLQEWMEENHVTLDELRARCGYLPEHHAKALLDGTARLKAAQAKTLERGTGIKAETWLQLEQHFRSDLKKGKAWHR